MKQYALDIVEDARALLVRLQRARRSAYAAYKNTQKKQMPMRRSERERLAVAHLRSAMRYERKGRTLKATAHFGRAMHYGASIEELSDSIIQLIIERALKGDTTSGKSSAYETLTSLVVANKRIRDIITTKVNFFKYASVGEIRKHPLYAFCARNIANLSRDWLISVESSGEIGESDPLTNAIKQFHARSVSEWYHLHPDQFHPLVKIKRDTTETQLTRERSGSKLDDFMAHLDAEPCTECAILQRDEPKEQIRNIISGTFTPVDIGKDTRHIKDLVKRYIENPTEHSKTYGHLCVWNTGAVKDMESVFLVYDGWKSDEWDVRLWDTRCVTNMANALAECAGSLHGVEHWNVAGVRNMDSMFHGATSFNRDIGNWDTSKVENMSSMFYFARSFNQDIGTWNTGNVTNMTSMFESATSFNQDISKWNTRNVKDRMSVFESATAMKSEYKPTGFQFEARVLFLKESSNDRSPRAFF